MKIKKFNELFNSIDGFVEKHQELDKINKSIEDICVELKDDGFKTLLRNNDYCYSITLSKSDNFVLMKPFEFSEVIETIYTMIAWFDEYYKYDDIIIEFTEYNSIGREEGSLEYVEKYFRKNKKQIVYITISFTNLDI